MAHLSLVRYIPAAVATALALSIGACADQRFADAAPTFRGFESAGSVQCEGGGTELPAMTRQLTDAGIRVVTAACGTDGRFHVDMCGASDGRIGIFEISSSDAETAMKIGFAPLANLPDAAAAPCG